MLSIKWILYYLIWQGILYAVAVSAFNTWRKTPSLMKKEGFLQVLNADTATAYNIPCQIK
jgi:hypothetical protein